MPCDAGTQGPPDSLQPGEPAIASSIPNWSASSSRTGRRPSIPASYKPGACRPPAESATPHRNSESLPMPDPMHPLQVKLDAFLGDVAVHPVPPYPRTRTFGRVFKSALERIGRVLRRRHAQAEGHCQGNHDQLDRRSSHGYLHYFEWVALRIQELFGAPIRAAGGSRKARLSSAKNIST